MARGLNQTIAWIISGGISTLIFGSVVGMMMSNKGKGHSSHDSHSAETHSDTSPDGEHHAGSSQNEIHSDHSTTNKNEEHSKTGDSSSSSGNKQDTKPGHSDEEEIKAESFDKTTKHSDENPH